MEEVTPKSSIEFVGRYTIRFPIIYLILTIGSVLFVVYDFANHIIISLDYFLIIGVIYYIYTLFIYSGKRQVTISNQGLFFNQKPINQRIKNVRKLDDNRLEIKFNILWILILKGNESDIDRLYQAFQPQ